MKAKDIKKIVLKLGKEFCGFVDKDVEWDAKRVAPDEAICSVVVPVNDQKYPKLIKTLSEVDGEFEKKIKVIDKNGGYISDAGSWNADASGLRRSCRIYVDNGSFLQSMMSNWDE